MLPLVWNAHFALLEPPGNCHIDKMAEFTISSSWVAIYARHPAHTRRMTDGRFHGSRRLMQWYSIGILRALDGASCLFVLLYFGFLSYGSVVSPSWRNLGQIGQQSLPEDLGCCFFHNPTITCTGTSDVTNTSDPRRVLLPSSLKLLWPEIPISK